MTWIASGLTAAELAAAAAAAGEGAVAGAGALGGLTAGGGVLGAMEGGGALAGLSPELLGMGVGEALGAPVADVMTPMSLAPEIPGVSAPYQAGAAMPMDMPIGEATVTGQPQMKPPTDWQSRMKGANQALNFASKFVPHKPSRDVLNMMAMTTGMGSGVSNPTDAMAAIGEPLTNLVGSAKENQSKEQQRLSQMMASTPVPSSQQQPMKAPASESTAPATAKAGAFTPPTRLTGDVNMMTPEDRLRMIRGY